MEAKGTIVFIATPGVGAGEAFYRALALAGAAAVPLTVLSRFDPGDRATVTPWSKIGGQRAAEGGPCAPVRLLPMPDGPWPSKLLEALPEAPLLVVKVAESRDSVRWNRSRRSDRLLLSSAPCSVWLLPARARLRTRTVLAAVELRDSGPDRMDRAVLRLATAIACWEGARLHVVHAWSFLGEPIVASRICGIGPSRARSLLRKVEGTHEDRLRALLESERVDCATRRSMAKGEACRVISEVARRTRAEVLVAGFKGRTGLSRLARQNLIHGFLATPGLGLVAVRADGAAQAILDSVSACRHSRGVANSSW